MDFEDLYRKIEQEATMLHACMTEYGSPLDELNENMFELRAELEGRTLDDLFLEHQEKEEQKVPTSTEEAVYGILYGFLAGLGVLSRCREKTLMMLARRIVAEVDRLEDCG